MLKLRRLLFSPLVWWAAGVTDAALMFWLFR